VFGKKNRLTRDVETREGSDARYSEDAPRTIKGGGKEGVVDLQRSMGIRMRRRNRRIISGEGVHNPGGGREHKNLKVMGRASEWEKS